MTKLNKEAINEISHLLDEVKDVVKLLKEWGIIIDSDVWSATSFNDSENILSWNKKNFEEIKEINSGDKFYIGGNVVTASQHEYKDKWIIAPKKLAIVEGEIFKEYLLSIMESTQLKHFKMNFKDEYGLTDNCGWEHWLIIETTVKESGLEKESDKMNIECILQALKDKGHIDVENITYAPYEMPKKQLIISKRGHELGTKIYELFKEKGENYIFSSVTIHNTKIEFIKKQNIDEWLELFCTTESNNFKWKNNHIDFELKKYMKEKGFELSDKCIDSRRVTNLSIKRKRLNEEEKLKQEALDLIDLLS